jgi:hypothetical protein
MQSMIVSPLQSIGCFCEHRGEDGPADAWQRIEDRRVAMLAGNGLGELFAEAVERQPGIGELAIDKPQLRDHHSDVRAFTARRISVPSISLHWSVRICNRSTRTATMSRARQPHAPRANSASPSTPIAIPSHPPTRTGD